MILSGRYLLLKEICSHSTNRALLTFIIGLLVTPFKRDSSELDFIILIAPVSNWGEM